ncbi:SIS domain-containing protein [Candidatus Daviesbacteria bacterium]|nr:SIS domain-containing protein [Candidatus Daviesbacteria bacterium]
MINVKNIARNYLNDLKDSLGKIKLADVQKLADVLLEAYKNDKTVYILGNGGAASTASHMACDLGKGTLKNVYNPREKRLRVVSLSDNVATMTAFANDLSFDDMFLQQLHNLVQEGDVVIGISGSGNTPNIIKALMYAKNEGAKTIGLLGYHTGGKAKEFVDFGITVQSSSYGIIEDVHLALNHLLTSCLAYMKEHIDNGTDPEKAVGKKINKSPKGQVAEWTERSARR